MTLSTVTKLQLDAALAHPRASSEVKNILNGVEGINLKRIRIAAVASGAEQKTSFTIPTGAIVQNVWLKVITAEATGGTKTIDIGTDSSNSGDADGFLDGVSVAGTGLVKGTLLNSGQTKGALLSVDESGSGGLVPESSIACGGKLVSFTLGSADFVELVADIYIEYIDTVAANP